VEETAEKTVAPEVVDANRFCRSGGFVIPPFGATFGAEVAFAMWAEGCAAMGTGGVD